MHTSSPAQQNHMLKLSADMHALMVDGTQSAADPHAALAMHFESGALGDDGYGMDDGPWHVHVSYPSAQQASATSQTTCSACGANLPQYV